MRKQIAEFISGFRFRPESDQKNSEELELSVELERARKEWHTARAYFDTVTDPELIDHAIYAMQASERKYMYLLKQARERSKVSNMR